MKLSLNKTLAGKERDRVNYGTSVTLPSNDEYRREFGRIGPYFVRGWLKFDSQCLKARYEVWVVVNSIKVFHVLITLEYRIIADDYSATQQIGVFFFFFFFCLNQTTPNF